MAFDKSSRIDNRIKTSPYEYEYKVGIRYPAIPSTLCLAIEYGRLGPVIHDWMGVIIIIIMSV